MNRRDFLRTAALSAAGLAAFLKRPARAAEAAGAPDAPRPNILFCMADDWGWPHAGAYGDPVVRTPTFDGLAREGILFEHAYITAPSCTPCRNAIKGLGDFLAKRPAGKPFCFWLGTSDPHRGYKWQSGAKSGIDIAKIRLPADLPDAETVRHDVADYYFEVQRWDRDVGDAVRLLEEAGELENTIVLMTGDHGMPFPRHKCNLYDSGTHVPLAVRWGKRVQAGRRVKDFVSLSDLAPTFLEAAGVPVPGVMTGRSLMNVLVSKQSGQVDPARDHVLTGRERHTPAQERPNTGGYPQRAIRTHAYLYIRNFAPDLWPAGAPEDSTHGNAYADCDGGPTKTFILEHKADPKVRRYYELAFAKRPAEELYDLAADPDQLHNVAGQPKYAKARADLSRRLMDELKATEDPRALGKGDVFATYPYRGRMKHRPPEWK